MGLETEDPLTVIPIGSQIVATAKKHPPMDMIGFVTSSYYSPNLKRSIALALVKSGRNRYGERVYLPMENGTISALIRDPVFFDPEGERLNG